MCAFLITLHSKMKMVCFTFYWFRWLKVSNFFKCGLSINVFPKNVAVLKYNWKLHQSELLSSFYMWSITMINTDVFFLSIKTFFIVFQDFCEIVCAYSFQLWALTPFWASFFFFLSQPRRLWLETRAGFWVCANAETGEMNWNDVYSSVSAALRAAAAAFRKWV